MKDNSAELIDWLSRV